MRKMNYTEQEGKKISAKLEVGPRDVVAWYQCVGSFFFFTLLLNVMGQGNTNLALRKIKLEEGRKVVRPQHFASHLRHQPQL